MDISVLIPVYKELQRAEATLTKLSAEPSKVKYEVLVAADCISREDAGRLEKLGAKVFRSAKRRGKVEALNSTSKFAKGELLVFLDSDTEPVSSHFLDSVWNFYKKEKIDIGMGKIKVDCKRRLHELANIDYLFTNSAQSLAGAFGEIPALNGAFFFMKRVSFEKVGRFSKVVVEDLDIALKAYRYGMRFKYCKDIVVKTEAPNNLKEWISQRKRWILGGLNSFGEDGRKTAIKKAPLSIASIMTAYPFPFTALVWTFLLLLLPYPLSITSVFAISYISTSAMILLLNHVMNWNIGFVPALNYIFLYSPLWSVFIFTMVIMSFFEKTPKIEDWVV